MFICDSTTAVVPLPYRVALRVQPSSVRKLASRGGGGGRMIGVMVGTGGGSAGVGVGGGSGTGVGGATTTSHPASSTSIPSSMIQRDIARPIGALLLPAGQAGHPAK